MKLLVDTNYTFLFFIQRYRVFRFFNISVHNLIVKFAIYFFNYFKLQ